MILTKIYYHVIGVIFKVLFMKLLVLLTFCFGFVVCIPRDWDWGTESSEYPEYYPEYYTEYPIYPIYPEHRGNLKKP